MKTIECLGNCLGVIVWIVVYGVLALPIMISVLIIQFLVTGRFLPNQYYHEENVKL